MSLNATDEETRKLAYLENSSAEPWTSAIAGTDKDDIKMILWDMAQSAYIKQSSQLAELIQAELNSPPGDREPGHQAGPFQGPDAASPARPCWSRSAFISNPEEEQKLVDEDFQDNVAQAIYTRPDATSWPSTERTEPAMKNPRPISCWPSFWPFWPSWSSGSSRASAPERIVGPGDAPVAGGRPGDARGQGEPMKATLFFQRDDGLLVAENRDDRRRPAPVAADAEAVLAELIKGSSGGLVSALPPETRLAPGLPDQGRHRLRRFHRGPGGRHPSGSDGRDRHGLCHRRHPGLQFQDHQESLHPRRRRRARDAERPHHPGPAVPPRLHPGRQELSRTERPSAHDPHAPRRHRRVSQRREIHPLQPAGPPEEGPRPLPGRDDPRPGLGDVPDRRHGGRAHRHRRLHRRPGQGRAAGRPGQGHGLGRRPAGRRAPPRPRRADAASCRPRRSSTRTSRSSNKPLLVAVNKIDIGMDRRRSRRISTASARSDSSSSRPSTSSGIGDLDEAIADALPAPGAGAAPRQPRSAPCEIAIIGRINVGKSSLANRLCGEERFIVSELPGTTRDSADILIRRGDKSYRLIDTAGIRKLAKAARTCGRAPASSRRARTSPRPTSSSSSSTPGIPHPPGRGRGQAIALESGKPLVIGLNKWDMVREDGPSSPGESRTWSSAGWISSATPRSSRSRP